MPQAPEADHLPGAGGYDFGRHVALLVRDFGLSHLERIEEAVEAAFEELEPMIGPAGGQDGVHPSRQLHLKARELFVKSLDGPADYEDGPDLPPADAWDAEADKCWLEMLFLCCHPSLELETCLAWTLTTVMGFGVGETAWMLNLDEREVRQRTQQGREKLVKANVAFGLPSANGQVERVDVVQRVLYFLFTLGADVPDPVIGRHLCQTVVSMCFVMTAHPETNLRSTSALMSVLLIRAAQMDARPDRYGCVFVLKEPDRRLWNRDILAVAVQFFNESIRDGQVSLFQLEAGISLAHCLAPSFDETDWTAILRQYDLLLELAESPIIELNRAVALGYHSGPEAAIEALTSLAERTTLQEGYLLDATLGEMCFRAGHLSRAASHFQSAVEKCQYGPDLKVLKERLQACS